jgi:hypothetical protein
MPCTVLLLGLLAACTPEGQEPGTAGVNTTAPDGTVAIDAFALAFRPPASFEAYPADDLAYAARSTEPPGLLTIDRATPEVIKHEAGPGEDVGPVDVGGPEAIVIENALIEGLQADHAANELAVANGDRSFSVIMSAPAEDLPVLWDEFIASVEVGSD